LGDGDAGMDLSNILPGDGTGNADLQVAGKVTKTKVSKILIGLISSSPKWISVLTHCRMHMRIAICCGRCENLYLLRKITYVEVRAAYTREWFAASLEQIGMCYDELESGEELDSSN
jgi:hypothetical protein